MKFNMGCGSRTRDDYVNVDKWDPAADEQVDLEVTPWPWPDNCADEVLFNHSLEHMGGTPEVFFAIMKELYRVCAPGARVTINAPHPRHDNFISDPTHVRAITPKMMRLFDRELNDEAAARGGANSRFAHLLGVDFKLVNWVVHLAEPYWSDYKAGRLSKAELDRLLNSAWNVGKEFTLVLEARKAL